MASQNLYYQIDPSSLIKDPIRLSLEAPVPVPRDGQSPHLSKETNEYMLCMATGDFGEAEEKLVQLANQADETIIHALLSTGASPLLSHANNSMLALHTIIKRSLIAAKSAGEIWSPLLNFLSLGRHETESYRHKTGEAYWSEETINQIKSIQQDLEILPTPGDWLLGASNWVAQNSSNDILEKIKSQNPLPWHPVLAAFASPITPQLVDFLLPVQNSMLTLIARPLAEADYVIILERTLHLLNENHKPASYYQGTMTPSILHRNPRHEKLENEREIFAHVMRHLGFIPETIRAQLKEAALYADALEGKAIFSGAQLLRATDQTVPGSEFIPLLQSSKDSPLAPLAGHRDFITCAKDEFYKKILPSPANQYTTLNTLLIGERTLDERVLMDMTAQCLKPLGNEARDSQAIVKIINHPSATPAIWTRIAKECEMTPVRIALASHSRARKIPVIRQLLLRMRIGAVVAPLLTDASPEEFLSLWQKLIIAEPKKALDMLEEGTIPQNIAIPPITIAPILKSGQKELIIRAMRITKFLTGTDADISDKDKLRAKTATIKPKTRSR